jgi:tRNA threonylcarbamoyl adenosine modification protein YeaZ
VLLRLVDDMLQETGKGAGDIAAILAGIGPGTFTGVRIAVATARALALALGVPIVGVSTLSALAAEALSLLDERQPGERPDLLVPIVDARRGQVFYGIYRATDPEQAEAGGAAGGRTFARTEPYAVCDREALLAQVATGQGDTARRLRVVIAGAVDGIVEAAVDRDIGTSLLPLEVHAECLLTGQMRLGEPDACMGGARLDPWIESMLDRRRPGTLRALRAGEPGSPEAVKPIYVRLPDADIHITKMRNPWASAGTGR